MFLDATKNLKVALLIVGSAISLFACDGADDSDTSVEEAMMTEYSENLDIVMSQNGRRSYHFTTPLVEGYTLAKEPYREFRKGVEIVTYKDDSLTTIDAVLTANYAIYYINRDLWEAKGNVVVDKKSDDETLYTQQLFWNARTKRIYSNVDSKIVQKGGRDVFTGEGFEADEQFTDWRFRRMKGRMEVDATPTEGADSTSANRRTTPPAATVAPPQPITPKGDAPSTGGFSSRRLQVDDDEKASFIAPLDVDGRVVPMPFDEQTKRLSTNEVSK